MTSKRVLCYAALLAILVLVFPVDAKRRGNRGGPPDGPPTDGGGGPPMDGGGGAPMDGGSEVTNLNLR